jgi:hypothetical protein
MHTNIIKMIFSLRYNSGIFCLSIILLLIIPGCGNRSQSTSEVSKSKERLSASQTEQGINIEKVSKVKFTAAGSVRIILPGGAGPLLKNIASVFTRQVQQRCNAKVEDNPYAALT